jgi:ABC-type multidrug transport system fused ATPase/permease subunit
MVRVDGSDLRAVQLADVRRAVGLVDDDPHVFGSTVAENVRLARPSATDLEVERALVAAKLGEWLATLPLGLSTFIGDAGDDVSGGERARLALARSLLADQPVLVLDEPVSQLDPSTAGRVLDDLLSSTSGRTIVLISQGAEALPGIDLVLDVGARPPVLTDLRSRAVVGLDQLTRRSP